MEVFELQASETTRECHFLHEDISFNDCDLLYVSLMNVKLGNELCLAIEESIKRSLYSTGVWTTSVQMPRHLWLERYKRSATYRKMTFSSEFLKLYYFHPTVLSFPNEIKSRYIKNEISSIALSSCSIYNKNSESG